jgi:hypothetical protein
MAGDVTVVGEGVWGAGFWIDRSLECGGGGGLVLLQVGDEAALLQPASDVRQGWGKTRGGVLLVLSADFSGQGRYQLLGGVALSQHGGKLSLGSGQRLTGDPTGRRQVGAAEGVEGLSGCRAGAKLLTATAVAGGKSFAAAGGRVFEKLLEDTQGVGVLDGLDVASAELVGRVGVLAAASLPPLAEQLAVRLGAVGKG